MQENNATDSRPYSVPRKIQNNVKEAVKQKTLEQIAHADLMISFHRDRASKAEDKKEIGQFGMQADKLERERAVNVDFMQWLEAA